MNEARGMQCLLRRDRTNSEVEAETGNATKKKLTKQCQANRVNARAQTAI